MKVVVKKKRVEQKVEQKKGTKKAKNTKKQRKGPKGQKEQKGQKRQKGQKGQKKQKEQREQKKLIEQYLIFSRLYKGISESTITVRKYLLEKIFVKEGLEIKDLNRLLIYLRNLSKTTQSIYIAILKTFYYYLIEQTDYFDEIEKKQIERLLKEIKPPRVKRRPKFLTREQTELLLEVAKEHPDKRRYAVIKFLLATGLRISELTSLSLADFQKQGDYYYLKITGKGSKERILRITTELYNELVDSGFFHKKISRSTLFRWIKDIGEQINIHVSPHMLRHTFAHNLVDQGVSLPKIQAVLGHSSLAVTDVYVKENSTALLLGKDSEKKDTKKNSE